ncbi:zinc finger protein 750 [Latimeria chalumnae]|uniref:zinc finger protein 750 n=1 Tax=Latimeria chalumnae TaxID=7897 RepID=UPI0003C14833|nr:PREDICTED: zinc finger protein 750 [Latimeria chalumnae]|eukprot:XP_006004312.1 PREDICTED: zinc finger protein 750 [Latimeria chalumnae]
MSLIKERKPKKPHYIPRPPGKPFRYKCFQCPFTCNEKSHLFNHMKYGLCKNSISLVTEQDQAVKCSNATTSLPPQTSPKEPTAQPALNKSSPAALASADVTIEESLNLSKNMDAQDQATNKVPSPCPRTGIQKEVEQPPPAVETESNQKPAQEPVARPSAFVPIRQHREIAESKEALSFSSSNPSNSRSPTQGNWKPGPTLSPPEFAPFCSIPHYVPPLIPEYPTPVFAENGLSTIYAPYLIAGKNLPEYESPSLPLHFSPDQRSFLPVHSMQPAGIPLPKPMTPTALDHYRLIHHFHPHHPLSYGFYSLTQNDHVLPSYALKLPQSCDGVNGEHASHSMDGPPLLYQAPASPTELSLHDTYRKRNQDHNRLVPTSYIMDRGILDSKTERERVKMSPQAGSAATGSPGRPSPTNFTQSRQTSEVLYDLSVKNIPGVFSMCEQKRDTFTAFRSIRKNTEQSLTHSLPHQQESDAATESINVADKNLHHYPTHLSTCNNETSSSSEKENEMVPLNLSKKFEPRVVSTPVHISHRNASNWELPRLVEGQDMPLNLSVKDSSSQAKWTMVGCSPPHPSKAGSVFRAEKVCTDNNTWNRRQNGGWEPRSETEINAEIHAIRGIENCDEQKQTAAVALCQLAACRPGRNTAEHLSQVICTEVPSSRTITPDTTKEDATAEFQSPAKSQKRLSQKDLVKAQQIAKRTRSSQSDRVLTLRKRPRVF